MKSSTSVLFATIAAISFVFSLNSFALTATWQSPDSPYVCAACDANSMTYVAHVICHDSKDHTYQLECTVAGGGGSSTASISYTTGDDFNVNCWATSFQPGYVYSMTLSVKETDTAATASTGPLTIKTIKVVSLTPDITYANTEEAKVVGTITLSVTPAVTHEVPVSVMTGNPSIAGFKESCDLALGPPIYVIGGAKPIAVHKPEGYVHFANPADFAYSTTLSAICDGPTASCNVIVQNVAPVVEPSSTSSTIPRGILLEPSYSISGLRHYCDPEGGTLSSLTGSSSEAPLASAPTVTEHIDSTTQFSWTAEWEGLDLILDTTIIHHLTDVATKSSTASDFLDAK